MFLSSLVKLSFNKITFIGIRIVLKALARYLWLTLYVALFWHNCKNRLFDVMIISVVLLPIQNKRFLCLFKIKCC